MSYYQNSLVIDSDHPASNFNQRIFYLVLHYTALNLAASLEVLTNPTKKVSSHYLIPETAIDGQRKIFQLVAEQNRAWHAGISAWGNRIGLNDTSIGIEIVNLGYKDENGTRSWYPFNNYQIDSVIKLAKLIVERYQIHPTCVIGHSDIAPDRKTDPGPLFPWKTLYENGVGAWFDEHALEINTNRKLDILKLQKDLSTYGYAIKLTGQLDQQTHIILRAFQMHFRPSDYSGNADAETVAIIEHLIAKYFPDTE